MKKLFVSNLNFNANENDVADAFEQYGEVSDIKVVFDRETNRSRGFGFVTFVNDEDADAALKGLHQSSFMGRNLNVSVAEERPRKPREPKQYQQNRYGQ